MPFVTVLLASVKSVVFPSSTPEPPFEAITLSRISLGSVCRKRLPPAVLLIRVARRTLTLVDHCPPGEHFTTVLATTYQNDPVAGIVKALPHPLKDIMLPKYQDLAGVEPFTDRS